MTRPTRRPGLATVALPSFYISSHVGHVALSMCWPSVCRSLQKAVSDSAYLATIEQLLEEKRSEISNFEADQLPD